MQTYHPTLLLILLPLFTLAQNYSDCTDALEICSKGTYIFEDTSGAGEDPDEVSDCIDFPANSESNSTWLRWEVEESGTIEFVISPLNEMDDLDFYLYRLDDSGDCMNKSPLRCMSLGSFEFPSPCMGSTGLISGETDTVGEPGCDRAENNYLAPVEAVAGEKYVLGINNFSGNNSGLRIELCGTMQLSCDSSSCSQLTSLPVLSVSNDFKVFPNPTIDSDIQIELGNSFVSSNTTLEVFDLLGNRVYQRLLNQIARVAIPIQSLPRGSYILQIQSEHAIGKHTIIHL